MVLASIDASATTAGSVRGVPRRRLLLSALSLGEASGALFGLGRGLAA